MSLLKLKKYEITELSFYMSVQCKKQKDIE